jgi:hypothetical protein
MCYIVVFVYDVSITHIFNWLVWAVFPSGGCPSNVIREACHTSLTQNHSYTKKTADENSAAISYWYGHTARSEISTSAPVAILKFNEVRDTMTALTASNDKKTNPIVVRN